ncbi:MAG: helix-turn-helix domain-containing protein [Rhodocyclales bacterium]|nr:helix-turn-helix domain-containing protein [Rhodocyclales bacterium]
MVKNITALARGLQVVETLQETGPISLAGLQLQTGLPKATLLRILRTLAEQGWVFRGLGDDRYRLRAELRIRHQEPSRHEYLIERAGPILEGLQEHTGWPSAIAVRERYRMHILESTARTLSLQLNYPVIGFQVHFPWSALGRVYLAYCPDSEREEIVSNLSRSSDPRDRIVDAPGWVDRLLREIRDRGYGTRLPRYWVHPDAPSEPLNAVAVPVMSGGQIVATFNMVWLANAMSLETVEREHLPFLRNAARTLGESVVIESAL